MKKLVALWLSLGLVMLATTAWGATQNAVVYGTVYDNAGNPMPGVSVMIENAALGFSRTAITGSDGSYNFAEVPPADDYKLTASKDGKTLDIRAGISVNVGDERVILPPLKEQAAAAAGGQVAPKVVTGQAVSNDTVSTTISGVITGDQLRSLPLYNRNFLTLGLLTPNSRDTEPGSELAGASFSLAGNRPSNNNFLLDGADNVASSSNQAIPFVVNDAVQEFRVTSATASAEFGRGSGGVVNIVTRRGGNAWHGSVFGYFGMDSLNSDSPVSVYGGTTFDQNAAYAGDPATAGFANFPLTYNQYVSGAEILGYCTDSNSFFTGVAGSVVCNNFGTGENTRFDAAAVRAANERFDRPFSGQQFGANIGGALVRDKLFGYVSYEGTRIDNPNPVFERVPTSFDRTYDPYGTGFFFFGPNDPNYLLGQNVLSLFPAPNVVAVPGVFEFFRGEAPNYTNVHNLILRGDYTASDNDTWTVRYVGQKLDQLHDATLPATGSYPGNGAYRDALNQNLVISYSHTFSPSVINEMRIGFNRFNVEEKAQDLRFDATSLGLPNSEMPTFFLNGIDPQSSGAIPGLSGAYTLSIDCCNMFPSLSYLFPFARVGAPLGAPSDRKDTTLFAADNLSFSIGKHSVRIGGEFRHLRNEFINDAFRRGFVYSSSIGEFTSGSEDCNEGPCGGFFGGFGSAFTAPSFDFAQFVPDRYEGRFRSWATAGYFQDTWRFHPRWTLNFGVRYEYFSPYKERGDRIWNYDAQANGLVQQARIGPVLDPYGHACGTIPTTYDSVPQSFSFFPVARNNITGTDLLVLPQGWNCSGTGNGEIINKDTNNVAPRGGIAWDMFGDGKTVLRFGIGWYFDQLPASSIIPLIYNRPMTAQNAIFGRVFDFFGDTFLRCPAFVAQCGLGNTMLDPVVQGQVADAINFFPNSYYSLAQQPFAINARDTAHSNTPYTRQISASVQQQVTNHLAFEVAYIGTSGKQLPVIYNQNFAKEWDRANPWADNFAFVPIFTMTNRGDSSYHSMMARVRAADWHGLRLGAAYSMSNSQDNASSAQFQTLPISGPNTMLAYQQFQTDNFIPFCIFEPTGCLAGMFPTAPQINFTPGAVTTTGAGQVLTSRYLIPQDPFNFLNDDMGRSDFHTKHRLVLDYTWDVPYGKDSKWMGNWQISGIFVAQSGQPFTIFSGPILNEVTQRVSITGPVAISNNPNGAIDSSNIILPGTVAPCRTVFGGLGITDISYLVAPGEACTGGTRRNEFTGPGFAAFNLAIQKGFQVFGEGRMLSLRAEIYNLTDRANFYNPISTASTDGVTQFADFGKIKSAHDPRQVQFAVRFTW
jgi:hypothetical protein